MLNALEGFEISFHDKSKRIIDVKINGTITILSNLIKIVPNNTMP